MAKGSKKGACSAHVERAKGNCLRHNRRDYDRDRPGYINYNLSGNNRTVFEDERIKDRKSIVGLVKAAERLYTQKTGQKCQKSFAPYREDVLAFPGNKTITDEQLMNFKAKVEQETGWKVMGIWLHMDEGFTHSKYIEGDEDFQLNIHAHVLYYCQDETTGKALRNDRKFFSLRQDWLASATGMERGNPAAETGRNHRKSAEQRIHSLETRLKDLEDVAREKERQHQEELKRMAKEKEEAIREAKASVWQRAKGLIGADKELNNLKGQIKALEATLATERQNYQVNLQKARKASGNAVSDLLRRIGTLLGITPSSARNNYTESAVMTKLEDHLKAEQMWMKASQKADKELQALKQGKSEGHGLKI